MLRGRTLDAPIFNQARERPFQGSVSIRRFGVAVDLPARGRRLGRGTVNVTAIPDLAMCVARAIAANQAQRLPSPVNQRQPAREILVVIQVLPEVDPGDGTVFGSERRWRWARPLAGWRPARAVRLRVENVPNPAMVAVSPPAMVANTARTAEAASDSDSEQRCAGGDVRAELRPVHDGIPCRAHTSVASESAARKCARVP